MSFKREQGLRTKSYLKNLKIAVRSAESRATAMCFDLSHDYISVQLSLLCQLDVTSVNYQRRVQCFNMHRSDTKWSTINRVRNLKTCHLQTGTEDASPGSPTLNSPPVRLKCHPQMSSVLMTGKTKCLQPNRRLLHLDLEQVSLVEFRNLLVAVARGSKGSFLTLVICHASSGKNKKRGNPSTTCSGEYSSADLQTAA